MGDLMENKSKNIDVMWKYVIFTYLLFWIMVLGLCGTFSMVFNASNLAMRWLSDLCAWSPTIVSIIEGKSFNEFFSYGMYSIPLSFLLSILSGPCGEESGWRGYLRVELEKRFGFVKGALILGAVWAFWHTVLWFVDCDFTGVSLIIYIISNVIVMTSLVIIMNTILKKSNNLIYAVWIHFCFNFLYSFVIADIIFYIILSIVYLIIASCFLFVYFKKEKFNLLDN